MKKAKLLLQEIEAGINADGGATFRQALQILLPKMADAYEGAQPPFRKHLGASLIGRECDRELWYSFRWAFKKEISPRLYRLFNRGHLEEARFLSLLLMVGLQLWYETEDGGQFRFSDVYGHFGSALDGVAVGVPDVFDQVPVYTEFKTSSAKIYEKIKTNGVQKEKPEHYAQMQVCMYKMDLEAGLYMVVNKDNDDIHAEIIEKENQVAEYYLHRAHNIIFSTMAPPRINNSPGWYKCKFCDAKDICHHGVAPEQNCRTCTHSFPTTESTSDKGKWGCALGFTDVVNSEQAFTGCKYFEYNRGLFN